MKYTGNLTVPLLGLACSSSICLSPGSLQVLLRLRISYALASAIALIPSASAFFSPGSPWPYRRLARIRLFFSSGPELLAMAMLFSCSALNTFTSMSWMDLSL